MANKVKNPKSGMGGNRYGGRWEKTEVLKEQSKTARRRAGLAEAQQQLPALQTSCSAVAQGKPGSNPLGPKY